MTNLNCNARQLGTKTIHTQESSELLDKKIADWCAENPDLRLIAIDFQFAGNEYSSSKHFVALITYYK